MFKTDQSKQPSLFAFTPRDMLANDSDVFLYIDLFDSLNLDEFSDEYSSMGQDSVDPRLMLRTIFYGLTHGVSSGRKLESAVRHDNRYIVLCGQYSPSYRTFNRFLLRHSEQMENLFIQVVRVAQELGLAKLGRIAIDGTRIKGYTSHSRRLRYEKLADAISAIKREISELRTSLADENHRTTTADSASIDKEIRDRQTRLRKIKEAKERVEREAETARREVSPSLQVSVNDPEARSLGGGKEAFAFGYNAQAVADGSGHQIIVAAEIADSTNDSPALPGLLDKVEENTGASPKEVLADAGYMSAQNIENIENRSAEPIVSPRQVRGIEKYSFLKPCSDGRSYGCIGGTQFKTNAVLKRHNKIHFIFDNSRCKRCEHSAACPLLKAGQKSYQAYSHEEFHTLTRHLERAKAENFKENYKQRKQIIEPVFGNLKYNKRLRLQRIKRKNALSWWKMICTAHNIEKIINSFKLVLHSPTKILFHLPWGIERTCIP